MIVIGIDHHDTGLHLGVLLVQWHCHIVFEVWEFESVVYLQHEVEITAVDI